MEKPDPKKPPVFFFKARSKKPNKTHQKTRSLLFL